MFEKHHSENLGFSSDEPALTSIFLQLQKKPPTRWDQTSRWRIVVAVKKRQTLIIPNLGRFPIVEKDIKMVVWEGHSLPNPLHSGLEFFCRHLLRPTIEKAHPQLVSVSFTKTELVKYYIYIFIYIYIIPETFPKTNTKAPHQFQTVNNKPAPRKQKVWSIFWTSKGYHEKSCGKSVRNLFFKR